MLKKTVLFLAAIMCALNIHALTISVNGSEWFVYSDAELASLSYPIPFGNKTYTGISIDEIFPAVYEAWRIELKTETESGSLRLSDPDFGDRLSRIYLVNAGGSWSLLYKNRLFNEIAGINLECEPLENDPLEIWINWEGLELLKAEINRYSSLHDIEIKTTEVPRPDSKLISLNQANSEVPDILMVQSSYIDKLAKSSSIQNLDYMYPDGLSKQGRYAFSLDDKVWAVPFYYDAQMLFCNPELIDTPDSDWNLENFEQLCITALSNDKIPSAWNSYSASFLIPFQIAFGKERLVEPDGSIVINDAPTLDALEYVLRLQNEGLMQPMERDAMTSLFVSGQAAMIISASYSIPHFKELGIPFTAVPLPVNTDTGIRVSPLLDYKAFAVTKRSRNTAGARRLIEYLCGIGVQQRFTTATAKLPVMENAWTTAAADNPYFEALSISSAAGTVIPTEKAYSVYKNTMWKMLRFAISGKMPAFQVLEKTQELVDKNLEDRN